MNEAAEDRTSKLAVERSLQALRLVSATLPHLAGLARLVRVKATARVPVAAVAASGLVLVNPRLFADLPLGDASYILAHELLHLALDTHGRQGRADPLVANFAHDYIINDILTDQLGRDPPLGGLFSEGAREKSFEQWVVDLSGLNSDQMRYRSCWLPPRGGSVRPGSPPPARSPLSRALADAGLTEPEAEADRQPPFDEQLSQGDVIPEDREGEFEPELEPGQRQSTVRQVRKAATKAASLAELKERLEQAVQATNVGDDIERADAMIEALRNAYHTPWQLALQRWMDALAPGDRTYARPSRRGADRTDVVLPGRNRQGWTLHIILDTSGSMEEYLPAALGAIAQFCESSGVADIHLVQCDTEVTRDEWLDPVGLATFEISGFGYSDMRPAMTHLANDPEVTAAMMLTDGYIDILSEPPPYDMLWVLIGGSAETFSAGYGQVISLER